jgi:flagellar FliL protein
MSAAAAAPAAEAAPKKGKKKLIIIIVAVVLLLVVAGGAAVFMMKKKAADEAAAAAAEDGGEDTAHVEKKAKKEHKKDDKHTAPTFVPVDRFAQIGITLQVDDPHASEEIKAYLPAIRNNILLLLSRKTSQELAGAEGKEKLARQVLRAAVLPMGIELEDEDEAEAAPAGTKKKGKHRDTVDDAPIKAVQFSSFIIQ